MGSQEGSTQVQEGKPVSTEGSLVLGPRTGEEGQPLLRIMLQRSEET
jgi:hypothetical protein